MSSWADRLNAAIQCWEREELDAAVTLLRDVIASAEPQVAREASHVLGGVLADQGDVEGARSAHREVIDSGDGGDPVLRQRSALSLGVLLINAREWPAARGVLGIASTGADNEVAALADAALAQVLTRLGDLNGAREAMGRVLRSDYSEAVEPALQGSASGLASGLASGPAQARAALTAAHDPAAAQAIQDTVEALERLRVGDLAGARTFLYRAIDAEVALVSGRASTVLALVELGEGDVELADELLSHVSDEADLAQGFAAAVLIRLLRSPHRERHPLLVTAVDHQRYGRERGVAGYRAAAEDGDPATSALATAMLARLFTELGLEPSTAAAMFRTAADTGDPLALSYTAVVGAEWLPPEGDGDAVIALLRRARDDGDPALVPWVAHSLGTVLAARHEVGTGDAGNAWAGLVAFSGAAFSGAGLSGAGLPGASGGRGEHADLTEAAAAFRAVLDSGHPGLRPEAEGSLIAVMERLGDLPGLCAMHEELAGQGDSERAVRHTWSLGFARLRLKEFGAARAAFGRIPESSPDLARSGVFAGHLLDRDFDAATPAFAQLKALGDSDDGYLMSSALAVEAADAWRRSGDDEAADQALSLMVADGHPRVAQYAAICLGALRDDVDDRVGAIVAWEKAAAGEDRAMAARAVHGIGCARRELGDLDGAADAFRRVAYAADEHGEVEHAADAARRLGEVLVEAGHVNAAREVFERFSGTGAVMDLARALRRAGNVAGAMEAYREAADSAVAATALVAASELAAALHGQGDVPGAIAAGERAIAAAESAGDLKVLAEAVHHQGRRLADVGDLAGARQAFERAAGIDPELAAFAILTLGDRLEQAGDIAGARAAFERAATLDDPRIAAQARDRLGSVTLEEQAWARVEEGDRAGALATFTELHGSADIAELVLTLHERRAADVRPLLERLAEHPGHVARAQDLVLTAARRHSGDGDVEGAQVLIQLAAEFGDPVEAAHVMIELAVITAEGGDADAAEALAVRAAEYGDPEATGSAWRHVATWRQRRGDVSAAIEAARRSAASGHVDAVVNAALALSTLLEKSGDVAGARAALADGAAADHPEALRCLRRLLTLLLREKDHEAALDAAERAIATGDAETVAMGYRVSGDVRSAAGDVDAAALLYRQGIEVGDPETAANLHVELAQLLFDRGDTAAAKREVEPALHSADPRAVVRAACGLGRWLRGEGDLAGAVEAFGRGAAIDTGADPDLIAGARDALTHVIGVAHQAHDAGEHALALRSLELAAKARPRLGSTTAGASSDVTADPVEIAKRFAAACAAAGDIAAARRYYEGATAFDAGRAAFLELDLADLLAEHGRRGEAQLLYERLHEHDDPQLRHVAGSRLLTLLRDQGDDAAAFAVAEARVRDPEAPGDSLFHTMLGVMQSERGDIGQALRTLRGAAEGGDPMALYMLAGTLVEAGETAEGRQVYQRLVDLGDAEYGPRAMLGLGQTYRNEKEARAREWFMRALEEGDARTAVPAAMLLGASAKRRRDLPEALIWYQRVIDSGDPSEAPRAAAQLGELCYWLGDREGLVRFYEQSLTMTRQPEIVGQAAFRLGELRQLEGDIQGAWELLSRAMESGDGVFAPQARELLARLS